ncbi:flagellar assembly protein FliH [Thalassobacillus hwangdonensis]|uniref:Flagellar assembly protein FliH n=1 Tax=Thalassobacillus hwangdonensis TaxID=546108 RepID=A0ABW3KWC0_9BACI
MFNSERQSTARVIGIRPVKPSHDKTLKEAQTDRATSLEAEAEKNLQASLAQMEKSKQEAERMIEQARQEIEREKQEWQKDKQVLKETVEQEAFQKGYADGERKAQAEYEEKLASAREIVVKAQKDHQQVISSSEETILALSIHAARKIIHQSIAAEPEAFLNVVKSVVSEVQNQPEIYIYVHPEMYSMVLENKPALQSVANGRASVSIMAKEGLEAYGCTIESPFGRIDASVDSQLNEIQTKLMDVCKEANPDG